jgi:carbamoyltransferase
MCDDSGLSIGASMYSYRQLSGDSRILPSKDTFFHGLTHDVSQYQGAFADEKEVARLLYNNKSVAVYNHLAEAGQRALGNRSILFNALNPNAKDIVNKIKNREWYRPFAAIVLEEDAHLYFDNVIPNPHMTVCFPVKTNLIPGVTHVDNTCRIQTVNSGHLHSILNEFKNLTGHGILLNTSFNLAGEPLVETPQDAFRTLNSSSLDYLWFYETKQLFNFTF